MPRIVGGLSALVALSAGILSHLDTAVCLGRAALALLLGWFGTQVWCAIFGDRGSNSAAPKGVGGMDEPRLERD